MRLDPALIEQAMQNYEKDWREEYESCEKRYVEYMLRADEKIDRLTTERDNWKSVALKHQEYIPMLTAERDDAIQDRIRHGERAVRYAREARELRDGITAIIEARNSGDFSPMLPKLKGLVG